MINKRALMGWDGWSGHKPRQCLEWFAPTLREAGFEMECLADLQAGSIE